jgi:enoyl-CoA hydratase/carnithine racemase
MYCGLADIYLAGDYTSVLEAAMRASPQALLDVLRAQAAPPPTPAPLAAVRAALDHHFALATVPQILASLESEQRDGYREWAQTTLEALNKRSPLMLCVTLEQLRRGKRLSLAACFRMELNMIYRCFEAGDFLEGVRALLVDKDNAPRWRHARVEEVQASELEAFFAPRWDPSSHPLRALN